MRMKHWKIVCGGLFAFAVASLGMSTLFYNILDGEGQDFVSEAIGWLFWLSLGGGIAVTLYMKSKFGKKTPEAIEWILQQGWEPYTPGNLLTPYRSPEVQVTSGATGKSYNIYQGARGTYNGRSAHAYQDNAKRFDKSLPYAGFVDISVYADIPDVVFFKDVGRIAQGARGNVDVDTEYREFNDRWMVNTTEYERIREIHALLNPRLIELIAHAPETVKCVAFENGHVAAISEAEDFTPEVLDAHLVFVDSIAQALTMGGKR